MTGLLAAIGYVLEGVARLRDDAAPTVPLDVPSDEGEVDDSGLILVAEIFERLSDRYLDEIRGWDALNGVLLGGIFALFVLFVDKVESFTWLPSALLVTPALMTAWNFRGAPTYSPDPDLFETAYEEDSVNALANLIASHKRNASDNGVLRNRKRSGFKRALIALIVVCLVAAAGKLYTLWSETYETQRPAPPRSRLLADARHPDPAADWGNHRCYAAPQGEPHPS